MNVSSSSSNSSSSDQQENQSLKTLLSHLTKTRELITALHQPSSSSSSTSSHDDASSFEAVELMLEPQESAKFSIALAFTLSTLYYILLNSKGKSTGDDGEKHPINAEISRIRQYVARMNQQQTNSKSSDNEVQKKRSNSTVIEVAVVDGPTLQIDKEAVGRMVKRNISHGPVQKNAKKQKK